MLLQADTVPRVHFSAHHAENQQGRALPKERRAVSQCADLNQARVSKVQPITPPRICDCCRRRPTLLVIRVFIRSDHLMVYVGDNGPLGDCLDQIGGLQVLPLIEPMIKVSLCEAPCDIARRTWNRLI